MASSEKIIAGEDRIADYLPQKAPMVMVGKLISAEQEVTRTSLTIREDNIFCIGHRYREAGLIENMAQTAAAGAGYLARQENRIPAEGFIGGIRNLKIYKLPGTGDEIMTEVKVEHRIFDAIVVTGNVYRGNELIATCEMKIFTLNQKIAGHE